MNHSYIPSQIDSTKCGVCKYDVISHTDMASCEACSYIGKCDIFMTMLMCPECIAKEKALQTENKNGEDKRINEVIERSRAVDYSISVKEDIFNAQTISINELKLAIENDVNITNKRYELANQLMDRYKHFSKIIFEKQQEISEESTKQRAVQSYLNQLASTLRTEERERLKLQDINYKPSETKPKVSKVTTKKGFDKVELVEWANKANVPLAALQMICVAKNMTPEQAYNHLKSKGL
jgi:hypothetical protein